MQSYAEFYDNREKLIKLLAYYLIYFYEKGGLYSKQDLKEYSDWITPIVGDAHKDAPVCAFHILLRESWELGENFIREKAPDNEFTKILLNYLFIL